MFAKYTCSAATRVGARDNVVESSCPGRVNQRVDEPKRGLPTSNAEVIQQGEDSGDRL